MLLMNQISEENKSRWLNTSVYDWANESLEIARKATTKYCHQHKNECQIIKQQPIVIDQAYLAKHGELINQRVQQAAIRLAHRLETLL